MASERHALTRSAQALVDHGTLVTPEEYREGEIERVLNSITTEQVAKLSAAAILDMPSNRTVEVKGVAIPICRFLKRLSELKDSQNDVVNTKEVGEKFANAILPYDTCMGIDMSKGKDETVQFIHAAKARVKKKEYPEFDPRKLDSYK